MLFITEYTLKPHMTKSEVKRLMDEFGKRGAGGARSQTTSRSTDGGRHHR